MKAESTTPMELPNAPHLALVPTPGLCACIQTSEKEYYLLGDAFGLAALNTELPNTRITEARIRPDSIETIPQNGMLEEAGVIPMVVANSTDRSDQPDLSFLPLFSRES